MRNSCIVLLLLMFLVTGCTQGDCVIFEGSSLNNATTMVPVSDPSMYNTTLSAASGKIVRISVVTGGLYEQPQSYRAIVRLDPRFENPVTYLASYNNSSNSYIANWAQLPPSSSVNILGQNIQNYINYVQPSLQTIPVNTGDAVNFRLLKLSDFYDASININSDLTGNTINASTLDVTSVITTSGGIDNAFIFTNDGGSLNSYTHNSNSTALNAMIYTGVNPFNGLQSIQKCTDSPPDITAVACQYLTGMGMEIRLSGEVIKAAESSFVPTNSTATPDYVYSILASSDGDISFTTPFDFSNQFYYPTITQPYAGQYFSYLGANTNLLAGPTYQNATNIANNIGNYNVGKYIFGRYLMQIDVGSSTGAILQNKIGNIGFTYYIKKSDGTYETGNIENNYLEINAPVDGQLFVKVNNPYKDIGGMVAFSSSTYTSSTVLSTFLNDNLMEPLKKQFLYFAAIMFGTMTTSGNFIIFLSGCLTLYITIYGLMFAIGMVNVTVNDITMRIIKLVTVSLLFSDSSWAFFNQYLFSIFLNTTDQLMNAVTNATATSGNIFGFIDPLVNKYTSPNLWYIIGNYLLFFGYGYALPGVLVIMGVLYFMKALIEVFLSYLTGYVALCVMIAMAPLFFAALLFEYTRSYFDNWLGIMVGYLLQPTLVMIFLLFIDQLSTDMLNKGLTAVCWQALWPIGFYWDAGVNINVTFFTINGFAPYILEAGQTSPTIGGTGLNSIPMAEVYRISALFFCIMRLAKEVVNLSTTMAEKLTSGGGLTNPVSGGGVPEMAGGLTAIATSPFAVAHQELGDARRFLVKKAVKRIVNGKPIKEDKKKEKGSEDQGDKADKQKDIAAMEKKSGFLSKMFTKKKSPFSSTPPDHERKLAEQEDEMQWHSNPIQKISNNKLTTSSPHTTEGAGNKLTGTSAANASDSEHIDSKVLKSLEGYRKSKNPLTAGRKLKSKGKVSSSPTGSEGAQDSTLAGKRTPKRGGTGLVASGARERLPTNTVGGRESGAHSVTDRGTTRRTGIDSSASGVSEIRPTSQTNALKSKPGVSSAPTVRPTSSRSSSDLASSLEMFRKPGAKLSSVGKVGKATSTTSGDRGSTTAGTRGIRSKAGGALTDTVPSDTTPTTKSVYDKIPKTTERAHIGGAKTGETRIVEPVSHEITHEGRTKHIDDAMTTSSHTGTQDSTRNAGSVRTESLGESAPHTSHSTPDHSQSASGKAGVGGEHSVSIDTHDSGGHLGTGESSHGDVGAGRENGSSGVGGEHSTSSSHASGDPSIEDTLHTNELKRKATAESQAKKTLELGSDAPTRAKFAKTTKREGIKINDDAAAKEKAEAKKIAKNEERRKKESEKWEKELEKKEKEKEDEIRRARQDAKEKAPERPTSPESPKPDAGSAEEKPTRSKNPWDPDESNE